MMSSSLSAWTRSQSKPNCSMTRGVKFSTRMSAVPSKRSSISAPSGRERSKVTPRLPMFAAWKMGLHSHQRSWDGGRVLAKRMLSGRVNDSTLITSAPSAARAAVVTGPAHQAVQSTMRTPARGSRQPSCRPLVPCRFRRRWRYPSEVPSRSIRRADRDPELRRTASAPRSRHDRERGVGGTVRRDLARRRCGRRTVRTPSSSTR